MVYDGLSHLLYPTLDATPPSDIFLRRIFEMRGRTLEAAFVGCCPQSWEAGESGEILDPYRSPGPTRFHGRWVRCHPYGREDIPNHLALCWADGVVQEIIVRGVGITALYVTNTIGTVVGTSVEPMWTKRYPNGSGMEIKGWSIGLWWPDGVIRAFVDWSLDSHPIDEIKMGMTETISWQPIVEGRHYFGSANACT